MEYESIGESREKWLEDLPKGFPFGMRCHTFRAFCVINFWGKKGWNSCNHALKIPSFSIKDKETHFLPRFSTIPLIVYDNLVSPLCFQEAFVSFLAEGFQWISCFFSRSDCEELGLPVRFWVFVCFWVLRNIQYPEVPIQQVYLLKLQKKAFSLDKTHSWASEYITCFNWRVKVWDKCKGECWSPSVTVFCVMVSVVFLLWKIILRMPNLKILHYGCWFLSSFISGFHQMICFTMLEESLLLYKVRPYQL